MPKAKSFLRKVYHVLTHSTWHFNIPPDPLSPIEMLTTQLPRERNFTKDLIFSTDLHSH